MPLTDLLIATLTKGARSALPFITEAVERGLSTAAVGRALESAGFTVRRQQMLDIVRALKDKELTRPYIQSVRDDLSINPAKLARPLTKTLRRFSFLVKLTGLDADTGLSRAHNLTISSDSLMTKAAIKTLALSYIPDLESGELGSGHLLGLEDAQAFVIEGTDQQAL
jgi:hypothetical protein